MRHCRQTLQAGHMKSFILWIFVCDFNLTHFGHIQMKECEHKCFAGELSQMELQTDQYMIMK